MKSLVTLLDESAARHDHLCPRQVLGVRMGMLAGKILGLDLPQTDKRLLVIVEADGCMVDGLSVATGCSIGHRTLRLEDYGKIAATFVDTHSGEALRIVPRKESRTLAALLTPDARNSWDAQLFGYQRLPAYDLFTVQRVQLRVSIEKLISRPGAKAFCERCGEEINNEREIYSNGSTLCQACGGNAYYYLEENKVEHELLSVSV